jgi:hypothetical protein
LWAIIGSAVCLAAAVLVLTHTSSDESSSAASSHVRPTSAGGSTQGGESAPVVTPAASGTYLSDLHPSRDLDELVHPGPVKISGSIYPKSISFYCNVGDATAFPAYTLKRHARRFQATIGLPDTSSPAFQAGIILVGDGNTLRMFTVSVPKPKTVDIKVAGVDRLQLECFGSGNSVTGGEAIAVEWGNARIS